MKTFFHLLVLCKIVLAFSLTLLRLVFLIIIPCVELLHYQSTARSTDGTHSADASLKLEAKQRRCV